MLVQLRQALETFVNIRLFNTSQLPGSIYLWTLTQQFTIPGMAASSVYISRVLNFYFFLEQSHI